MHRFLIPPGTLTGSAAVISGEAARQIARVLRMRPGDELCLLDGEGSEWLARIATLGKNEVTADLLSRRAPATEPTHAIVLYLSLLNKPDKFEWALQKCTELGVSRFVPVLAEHSVPGHAGQGRQDRWERIVREAVEQSGRVIVPLLAEPFPLTTALEAEAKRVQAGAHVALMPALGASATIPAALQAGHVVESAGIFIGPEGGFTNAEVQQAQSMGILPVTMGRRTLRSETAAVAAVTLVMSALGEMG